MMDQLDFIGRTGEMARTFGIDFYSGGKLVGSWWEAAVAGTARPACWRAAAVAAALPFATPVRGA